MKNTSIFTVLLCLFSTTVSYANPDWQAIFYATYGKEGVKPAVTEALEKGIAPKEIINAGVDSEKTEIRPILTVLYCAGVDGKDIQDASKAAAIDTETLILAYEDSVAECGDMLADDEAAGELMSQRRTAMPSPGTSPAGASQFRYSSPSTY